MMCSPTPALLAILALPVVLLAAGGPIPFPKALDAAAIAVERLDDIREHSLILGNGDVNALLYSDGSTLALRLTKNDVWDARLDTSSDPPLLPIARIKELAKGDWPKGGRFGGGWLNPDGTPYSGPNSWSKPYPVPRTCGIVRLGHGPATPAWRRIRAQGTRNAWERRGNATVMSIEGKEGASNGWALSPLDLPTDDYTTLRVRLAGSENARFFIDLLDPGRRDIFGHRWMESPTTPEERVFKLPAGQRVGSIVLYTWTEDGKPAENRFESVVFEGPKGKVPIDLTLIAPPSCPGRLDIRRAVAHVAGAPDGVPKATVRALADRNAFLIESDADPTLEPILDSAIPEAETGSRNGIRWLHQKLPPDPDWPGMEFAVALAAEGNRKAVAIVTTFESRDVVWAAADLARTTLEAEAGALARGHEADWERFWAASGIDLADPALRDAWYRNLYFLRCVSRPGSACVGLYAGLVDDRPRWHGSHTTNYNSEQTFWGGLAANHTELTESYIALIADYLPRARWLCRQLYACDGAYLPHNIFCHEPPRPETCKSRIGRQQFYVTWSYTIGVSGFTVQNLWLQYKYAPDRAYLEKTAYPAVRDVATFYANFIAQCEEAGGGKVVLGPSVSPEHWGWTKGFARNRNCAFDIAFARTTMEAAIEGAGTLDRDRALVARWRQAILRLPDYPTTEGEEPVVVDVEGAPPITYNIAVPACPVFPADCVTWFSPRKEKALFARTIEKLKWNGNNSSIIMSIARARLSLPGTAEWVRETLGARLRPNGTFTLNRLGSGINNAGHYTEQFAATAAVSELLLQSVSDIVRVFPAWPPARAARFTRLRAQGGFLVSAEVADGAVGPIAIESTAGGTLRLLSPWPTIRVKLDAGEPVPLTPDVRRVVRVDTQKGGRLLFTP